MHQFLLTSILSLPNKIAADDTFIYLIFFNFYLSKKIRLDVHVNPLLADDSRKISSIVPQYTDTQSLARDHP